MGAACSTSAANWRDTSAICWWRKWPGANTRLIAASAREQENLARDQPADSREEDLTRYLQLTLDLFKDLQFSLQPRLHLEIGLLRMIHAGRLLPIEEALADLGSWRSASNCSA